MKLYSLIYYRASIKTASSYRQMFYTKSQSSQKDNKTERGEGGRETDKKSRLQKQRQLLHNINLSMLLTAVNLVAGTGSDSGIDINGYLRRLANDCFLH